MTLKNFTITALTLIIGLGIGFVLTANFDIVAKGTAASADTQIEDLTNEIETLRSTGKVFTAIAKKVTPAVVTITSEKIIKTKYTSPFNFFGFDDDTFERFFNQQTPQEGEIRQPSLGSGVIVSEEGYILTNNHVVEKADEIEVMLQDERKFSGELIGTDPKTDLAVIKIKSDKELPYVKMGDSEDIEVGEWALAIGSPFHLSSSVTAGIISAKGRSNVGLADYEDFIQTDAAINPGNSGGALVNLEGELVGINTAIATRSGGNMGIGFAIPVNMARNIMEDLIDDGKVSRGWIGVFIQDLDESMAKGLGLDEAKGILVPEVQEDSPAEKAGIERGDVIIKLNGDDVNKTYELRNKVASMEPGTQIDIVVLRDGKEKKIKLKLGELDQDQEIVEKDSEEDVSIGITVENITNTLAQRYSIDADLEGVLVTDMEPYSNAYRSGIRTGDVILEANKTEIKNVSDYKKVIKDLEAGDAVVFLVRKGENTRYVAVEIEEKE